VLPSLIGDFIRIARSIQQSDSKLNILDECSALNMYSTKNGE